jgi:hypothetical protein
MDYGYEDKSQLCAWCQWMNFDSYLRKYRSLKSQRLLQEIFLKVQLAVLISNPNVQLAVFLFTHPTLLNSYRIHQTNALLFGCF